jgi:putative heme-binding domain-containing protein
MSDDVLASGQNLLTSRRAWAEQFLEAMEAHVIDPGTVPREIVGKLTMLGDARITARANKLFGPIKPATSAELHAQIERLAAVVRAGSGVPKPGKQIFDRTCARCHALFGKGGKLGPDLTTYRRDDLETMLLNIVNPSAEVREGYTASVIAMADGRVIVGVVGEQDRNVVILRSSDGNEITLDRKDIDAIQPSPSSIMPEGLLSGLGDQQVRDLFAYLRCTQPLID